MQEAKATSIYSVRPNLCLGVDQTGAVARGGLTWKKLPAARAYLDQRGIQVQVLNPHSGAPFELDSFSTAGLMKVIQTEGPSRIEQTRVLVDCVLGLPASITTQIPLPPPLSPTAEPLRWALKAAAQHHRDCLRKGVPARGRPAAEAFFLELFRQSGLEEIPERACEKKAGANSVFRARPYQKNVQTGTYRIWVELGLELLSEQGALDLQFPHHEDSVGISRKISVEESWPSLLWREFLGFPSRQPKALSGALQKVAKNTGVFIHCAEADLQWCAEHPDHADALVLALAGFFLPSATPDLIPSGEGWITGLAKT